MTNYHRCFALAVLLGATLLVACGQRKKEPVIGDKVRAPWGAQKGGMYAGKVKARYGKLVEIDFDDGDHGWADVSTIVPPGTPLPTPTDTCAHARGARVSAPWSRSMTMYRGVVSEVHGNLLHVSFDDGDHGWARCASAHPVD